eukprot:1151922-Pelagomonas_calceolata.AAC.1
MAALPFHPPMTLIPTPTSHLLCVCVLGVLSRSVLAHWVDNDAREGGEYVAWLCYSCMNAYPQASSSATVMFRNPGQARGGQQQGGGPRIESLWPGWR